MANWPLELFYAATENNFLFSFIVTLMEGQSVESERIGYQKWRGRGRLFFGGGDIDGYYYTSECVRL